MKFTLHTVNSVLKILLEKLMVIQLVEKFTAIMKPQSS